MSEELQPYAVLVYLLVALSFLITPWASWLFWKWRNLVESPWQRWIFTTIPIVMMALFLIRVAVLFKLFESVDLTFGRLSFHVSSVELQIFLSYIGFINGFWMVWLFDLGTRAVLKEKKRLEEAARGAGEKTSEILASALEKGYAMQGIFANFLRRHHP